MENEDVANLETGLPGSASINLFWFPFMTVANVVGLPKVNRIGRVIVNGRKYPTSQPAHWDGVYIRSNVSRHTLIAKILLFFIPPQNGGSITFPSNNIPMCSSSQYYYDNAYGNITES